MPVQSDIQKIRDVLNHAEADPSRRNVRKLHNLLAELMAEHKDLLGLTGDEVTAFGGGVPKPEDG